MEIQAWKNEATGTRYLRIEIPERFVVEQCEPYAPAGSPILELITHEQGIGIIQDAVLMAMHLKLRKDTVND